MPVLELRVQHLRCLDDFQIEPDARLNVISGANGAGKTSVLEAIYLLGRGRSFRAPRLASVIQSGQKEASLFVRVQEGDKAEQRLGLSVQKTRTEARLNGNTGAGGADLIATLPVQLIDPQIHELIQGGPAERRRFLDWGVFHVKHEFRMAWARYRRALSQRNAALRQALDSQAVQAWDSDLLSAAESIDRCRQEYLQEVTEILAATTQQLLDLPTTFTYQRGWSADKHLGDVLHDGLERDRAMGSTQAGPHRAELQISVDGHPARHRLSRGQQKLCAAALVLGQGKFVIQTSQRGLALLVDEPAAELDSEHLARLFQAIQDLGAQVFITALDPEALGLASGGRVFHVEHGKVANLV